MLYNILVRDLHFSFFVLEFPLQRRRSHQAGRSECSRDEAAERPGGEVCLPGRGQPDDEADHQLSLPQQRGGFSL